MTGSSFSLIVFSVAITCQSIGKRAWRIGDSWHLRARLLGSAECDFSQASLAPGRVATARDAATTVSKYNAAFPLLFFF